MTSHAQAEQLIAAAIDFTLTPAEQGDLDAHLAACPSCREQAAGYRSDAATIRSFVYAEPPAFVRTAVLQAGARPAPRWNEPWKLLVAATLLLAALLAAAAASGAWNQRPALVVVVPSLAASSAPSAVSSAGPAQDPSPAAPSTEPTPFAPPAATCPSPAIAVRLPDVTVSVGGGPRLVAARGSTTTITCTTTASEDAVPSDPTQSLTANQGDRMSLALPSGWGFLHWEGYDRPAVGDAGNIWPPTDIADHPMQVEVPVPFRAGDSIADYDLWIVRDDGRVVGQIDIRVRVSVSASADASPAALIPRDFTMPVPPAAGTTWRSISWRRLDPVDPLAQITSVVRWRNGFVAVGTPVAIDGTGTASRTPIWTSSDGASWKALDAAVLGPTTIVIGVGETADGIAALTLQGGRNHCDPQDPSAIGLVCWTMSMPLQSWTSTDGMDWTAHPGPDLGWTPLCAACGLDTPVFRAGPTSLLVINRGVPDSTTPSPLAAVSVDGITWDTSTAVHAIPANLAIDSISGTRSGFVAAGDAPGIAAVLSSIDGRAWTTQTLSTTTTATLDPIIVGPGGLIAPGLDASTSPSAWVWWSSTDLRDWTTLVKYPPLGAMPDPNAQECMDACPDGTLVGDGERFVAYRGWGTQAGWTSSDGRIWQPLTFDGRPEQSSGWLDDHCTNSLALTSIGVSCSDSGGSIWFGTPLD